ncbi:MAG TPA: bifunctional methylenetetrahydrofolate dehydrogenase/methenyltetrahydrofolate cyclohydrolase, partial [Candidatus Moranbacteria bacterium]|nr:bifunctional methylenetetrahydrofolate dehydrogenase/methenyltetrahydrofolate cyclohydrolase [Candidatus Moranbacteria bacterium]
MELIKGKPIAESILTEIKKRIEKQFQKPKLVVIMIGNDEASQIYVKLKEKASENIGINFQKIIFPAEVEEVKVIEVIKKLNEDFTVNGIIVQLPLPPSLNKNKIVDAIAPDKDVDGFHRKNRNAFL